jgi:hypothetical protein
MEGLLPLLSVPFGLLTLHCSVILWWLNKGVNRGLRRVPDIISLEGNTPNTR